MTFQKLKIGFKGCFKQMLGINFKSSFFYHQILTPSIINHHHHSQFFVFFIVFLYVEYKRNIFSSFKYFLFKRDLSFNHVLFDGFFRGRVREV